MIRISKFFKSKAVFIIVIIIVFMYFFVHSKNIIYSDSCKYVTNYIIRRIIVSASFFILLISSFFVLIFRVKNKGYWIVFFVVISFLLWIFRGIKFDHKRDKDMEGHPMEVTRMIVENTYGSPKGKGCGMTCIGLHGKLHYDHSFALSENECRTMKEGDTVLVLVAVNCRSFKRKYDYFPTKEELEKFSSPHYVLYKRYNKAYYSSSTRFGKIYSSLDSLPAESKEILENMGTREACEEKLPWWYIDF